MKTKTVMLFCILCLAALLILGSCATTMKTTEKMIYEKFCGTWVNTKYDGVSIPPVKLIFNPDGTWTSYWRLHESSSFGRGNYVVEKRWTDSEGYSWYHVMWTEPLFESLTAYMLFKLDKYNTILEYNYSGSEYPEEVGPKVKYSDYRIYYRY